MIKKSGFYKKYTISSAEPIDVSKHQVPISAFMNTIKEFLDTEFTGLIDINCEPLWDINVSIRVSEDFTAYFFKNLLAAIYGRETVIIDMKYSGDLFTLTIHSDEHLPIDYNDMNELLVIASNAGFSYELTNEALTLSAKVKPIKRFSVRSIGINVLRKKLEEIFFTGAPAPDFRGWD